MSAQQFPKSVYKRRTYQQHHIVSNPIAASQDKVDFQNKEHMQAVPHSQLHSESLPSITTSKQGSAIQDIIIVPSYLPISSNIVAFDVDVHIHLSTKLTVYVDN